MIAFYPPVLSTAYKTHNQCLSQHITQGTTAAVWNQVDGYAVIKLRIALAPELHHLVSTNKAE